MCIRDRSILAFLPFLTSAFATKRLVEMCIRDRSYGVQRSHDGFIGAYTAAHYEHQYRNNEHRYFTCKTHIPVVFPHDSSCEITDDSHPQIKNGHTHLYSHFLSVSGIIVRLPPVFYRRRSSSSISCIRTLSSIGYFTPLSLIHIYFPRRSSGHSPCRP